MATFDQLPADQRAIIELVLKRGRTYDALSDMLDMPASRVRELARDALSELAPHTAERVDPDWRDQVADYILGQQSGPESTATQGHLRRSEPARAWLLSLMDSLDHLYANGKRPEIPEPGAERTRGRRERGERGERRREREPARATGTRERERDRDADEDEDEGETKKTTPLSGGRKGGPLSPAARATVMRRRLIAGGAAVAALLVVLVLVLVLTGDDDDGGGGGETTAAENPRTGTTGPDGQPQPELIGQLQLAPVGKRARSTRGVAGIAKVGEEFQIVVQAQLPPRPQGGREAYEVWLYNSDKDAVAVGAQNTDERGIYQGAGKIPADYAKYKFVDISVEPLNGGRGHSGRSILRGELAKLQAPPAQQPGGQGGAPEGGAPAP